MACSCRKKKAKVSGLKDTNWNNILFTVAGGVAGQLVNGALSQIENLDGKHGAKAAIKAGASIGLIGFVDGDWSTPLGAGMLVETGVTFLKESNILAGVGKVYSY